MEQKIIELANLYDVEISDTPGCKIVENGVERLATKDDADKIFRFNELLEKIEKKDFQSLKPNQISGEDFDEWIHQNKDEPLSPARGIINGLIISIPIWIVVGLIVWWVTK